MNAVAPGKNSKSFMAPVWIMASIVVVRIIIMANTIIAMRQLQLRHGAGINKFALLSGSAFIIIALAEAIVYWRIRIKKYNRARARAHLLLMLVSMVVLPLLFILFARTARFYLNSDRFVKLIRTFSTLQFYLFWIGFIAGTLLFVSIAINAFSPAEEQLEDMIDSIGDD